jgi:rod shape-determining protein MreD
MIPFFLLLLLYTPIIYYNSSNLSPNFFIIIIIYCGFKYNRITIIIISFFLGIFQDFLIQYEYLGITSILIISFGYAIGNIKKIKNIYMKYIFIIISIFIFFYSNEFITSSENFFLIIKNSLINTFITVATYFLIRFLFRKRFFIIEK